MQGRVIVFELCSSSFCSRYKRSPAYCLNMMRSAVPVSLSIEKNCNRRISNLTCYFFFISIVYMYLLNIAGTIAVTMSVSTLDQSYKCAVAKNENISLFINEIPPELGNMCLYMMFIK